MMSYELVSVIHESTIESNKGTFPQPLRYLLSDCLDLYLIRIGGGNIVHGRMYPMQPLSESFHSHRLIGCEWVAHPLRPSHRSLRTLRQELRSFAPVRWGITKSPKKPFNEFTDDLHEICFPIRQACSHPH